MLNVLMFGLVVVSVAIMIYQAKRIRHMDEQIEQTINILERCVTDVALAASDNTVTGRILDEEQYDQLSKMPAHKEAFQHGVNVGVNYAVRYFDDRLGAVEDMLDNDDCHETDT